MDRSLVGSYAHSGALSTTHYKLVNTLQRSPTAEDTNATLLSTLGTIRHNWSKKAPSPSNARHDLVLLLYARDQRTLAHQPLAGEERELFAGEWALPTAVLLAGGGGGGTKEREMGYRACAELFTAAPHPLKLLLINTIRSDLYASPDEPKAEARVALALRAIAAPALTSPELTPAVREGVLGLVLSPETPDPIRRLALEALLSLVRTPSEQGHSSEPSSLVQEAQHALLTLLLPPPPSAPSSSHRRRTRRTPTSHPLPFLAALSSAIAPSSPIHPVLPAQADRLRLHLALLRQVVDYPADEARRTRYKGLKGGWALARVLDGLRMEVEQAEAKEAGEVKGEVREAVWDIVQRLLHIEGEMSNALILFALRLLPFLPAASDASAPAALPTLLTRIHATLLRPTCPADLLFALRSLALLPPSSWATPAGASSDKGKSPETTPSSTGGARAEWGEPAWRALLSGLDHADPAMRTATLALLQRVDPKLVQLHYDRLLHALSPAADTGAEKASASVSSAASTSSKTRARARATTVPRLLETLPYLSPPSPPAAPQLPSALPPAGALLALLEAPQLALAPMEVLAPLVLPVLDAFRYEPSQDARREFARGLFEAGKWREGATAGLLVAGTVHEITAGGGVEGGETAAKLATWLANEEGSAPTELVQMLQEPFLFAFLRLLALSPSETPPASLADTLARAASSATSDTAPLFNLAAQVAGEDDVGHQLRGTSRRVGEATRLQSLAEFGKALLAAVDGGPPQPHEPSTTALSRRLDHSAPAPASAPSQPLRYTYAPSSPSSASPSSPFSALSPPSLTSAAAPASPARVSVSAAALAREQRDLLRERADRGGTGTRAGGGTESLMGAGELALRVGGVGLEEEEEPGEEAEGGGEGNALGLVEGAEGKEHGRKRVSTSSATDGDTSGEPPADLLQLDNDPLDPFHSGGH
ncbi:hypothetical protein JCM10207_007344 [Rhodosporidiobolus poonsookiae]